jgi:type VI secretion system secreted protein Hcp
MALDAYLTLTGETQGKVKGGVTHAGREDMIEVYGWSHEVTSPRDAASGLPTGKRRHQPITCIKPIDRASPILMNILTNNENITEWRLDCWRPSRSGKEFQYYTIELINASIAGISQEQLNNTYAENMPLVPREHVMFTYQKIIWTWQDGGITAEDDWEVDVA